MMQDFCQFRSTCHFYSLYKNSEDVEVRQLISVYCNDENKAGMCSRSLVRKYYDTELISIIGPEGHQISLP